MKAGSILLVLAALLVAMLVPAFAVTADNGVFAPTLDGTKTIIQEEVGVLFAAENMTALAAVPNVELAVSTNIMMTDSEAITRAVYYHGRNAGRFDNYKSTPGAGGDGFARSIQRLTG